MFDELEFLARSFGLIDINERAVGHELFGCVVFDEESQTHSAYWGDRVGLAVLNHGGLYPICEIQERLDHITGKASEVSKGEAIGDCRNTLEERIEAEQGLEQTPDPKVDEFDGKGVPKPGQDFRWKTLSGSRFESARCIAVNEKQIVFQVFKGKEFTPGMFLIQDLDALEFERPLTVKELVKHQEQNELCLHIKGTIEVSEDDAELLAEVLYQSGYRNILDLNK